MCQVQIPEHGLELFKRLYLLNSEYGATRGGTVKRPEIEPHMLVQSPDIVLYHFAIFSEFGLPGIEP